MRRARRSIGVALVLAMALAVSAAPSQPPGGKISAKPLTYADLGKLVRGFRGKVVVVDFWSTG